MFAYFSVHTHNNNPMMYDLRETATKMCEICTSINWKVKKEEKKLSWNIYIN